MKYLLIATLISFALSAWAYHAADHAGDDFGAAYTTNDVIGIALDMTAGTVEFFLNGSSQGIAYSGLTGTVYAAAGEDGQQITANFGASAFAFAVPAGFNSGLYN